MAVENGEWIMMGVAEDDPSCVHTADELIELIDEVGFLPLFKNAIPGFSVEEHIDFNTLSAFPTLRSRYSISLACLCGKKRLCHNGFLLPIR